jgi:hypothetical protein
MRVMEPTFRVVTWNCRRASTGSSAWDYLLELDPDLALLQEMGGLSPRITDRYACAADVPATPSGRPQPFRTGLLVKGRIAEEIALPAPNDWVARELAFFRGNFVARDVELDNGVRLRALSAYCPAFPVDRARLQGVDTTGVQLTQNPDVWATELLWASLKTMGVGADELFLVGGDFNSSETFDTHWGTKPRGNREIIERMNALGFWECLRTFQGRLIPTFRSPRGGSVVHQIDHLYATRPLLRRLVGCQVGASERVFAATPALSDHLPIVADFRCSG